MRLWQKPGPRDTKKDEGMNTMQLAYKMMLVGEEDVELKCGGGSHVCNLKKYQKFTEFHNEVNHPPTSVVILTVRSEFFNIQRIFGLSISDSQWFLETYFSGQKEYIEKDDISKRIHDPQFYINDLVLNTVGYLQRNHKNG